ncbi:glycosyltransferase family 4 protein [Lichenicola cladoniae]|uniref:Glycosyltransferase family 4 protein n=1 Tax=Lichenicola cladoniae TaxID=1484109 RepID=A0A6M8HPW2_9PROT|nr:glycosyltransferase family 1 protein [Lichenicola cladoniae]NPD66404.1 glycosyltransferase family 4 protein [Acetobacteraceae bacterium]QKE90356.1 glycosyltransferase family 4 protein [Lichenicola cladoniae]
MGQASAVWIDVEDLFHYVGHNARLSGIQRLTYELYAALEQQSASGRQIGFVRIDPRTDEFVTVTWEQVHGLCHGLTTSHVKPDLEPTEAPHGRFFRKIANRVQARLPGPAQEQFAHFCRLQVAALNSLCELGRQSVRRRGRRQPQLPEYRMPPAVAGSPASVQTAIVRPDGDGRLLHEVARSGDWLLSLGASWHRVDYGRLLHRTRIETGVKTGLLLYDLIPIRRPEWCHHTLVETFERWFEGVLPSVDAMFAISQATADDAMRLLGQRGRGGFGPIRTIPVGTGFPASVAAVQDEVARVSARALPAPGSYVLIVSTIEARKNHALMFQVWRKLARDLPPNEVPTLVFAGRIGWLVSDLMLQIANTNYVDGKLLVIEDPSDAVLMRLYEGCLFTVMPSFFEGWGLPVTESMAAGKPCVVSNVTSLPEAGAGLVRMFDPYDFNDAYRVIYETVRDRDGLALWEQEVRRSFRPVAWATSADVLLNGLDMHDSDRDEASLSRVGTVVPSLVTHG